MKKIFIFFVFTALQANADGVSLPRLDPYHLKQQKNYLSLSKIYAGNLEIEQGLVVPRPKNNALDIQHLGQTQIDKQRYIVWNVVPVGIGYLFPEKNNESISAEMKVNYEPEEEMILSPNFTGRKKYFTTEDLGSEFVFSYSYHYKTHPKPSFWDVSLKYSVLYKPIEKWLLGLFVQPKKYLKGMLTVPNSKDPFEFENIYSSGIWTEWKMSQTFVFQVEGVANFFDRKANSYLMKYSMTSSLGYYF